MEAFLLDAQQNVSLPYWDEIPCTSLFRYVGTYFLEQSKLKNTFRTHTTVHKPCELAKYVCS